MIPEFGQRRFGSVRSSPNRSGATAQSAPSKIWAVALSGCSKIWAAALSGCSKIWDGRPEQMFQNLGHHPVRPALQEKGTPCSAPRRVHIARKERARGTSCSPARRSEADAAKRIRATRRNTYAIELTTRPRRCALRMPGQAPNLHCE